MKLSSALLLLLLSIGSPAAAVVTAQGPTSSPTTHQRRRLLRGSPRLRRRLHRAMAPRDDDRRADFNPDRDADQRHGGDFLAYHCAHRRAPTVGNGTVLAPIAAPTETATAHATDDATDGANETDSAAPTAAPDVNVSVSSSNEQLMNSAAAPSTMTMMSSGRRSGVVASVGIVLVVSFLA